VKKKLKDYSSSKTKKLVNIVHNSTPVNIKKRKKRKRSPEGEKEINGMIIQRISAFRPNLGPIVKKKEINS